MEFELLTIELHKHSQSWICLLQINKWRLFYIEWDYNRRVEIICLFGKWL